MVAPVVVMSALEAEYAALLQGMDDLHHETFGEARGYLGTLDGGQVLLVRAGVGKVSTATAVGMVWERCRSELFIFSGVAGGLAPDLTIGDIVVGEHTIQHDAGVLGQEGLERYQAGHVPFFNPTEEFGYRPSIALLEKARKAFEGLELEPVLGRRPRVRFGTILTGDQYLQHEATRQRLHSDFGGEAIEMEGAAMAQAAGLVGADHLVIRALSDLAGEESIADFGRYVREVSANTSALVRRLLSAV